MALIEIHRHFHVETDSLKLEVLMSTIQEALVAVKECNDKADSLILLVQNMAEQIKAIPAMTPEQQAAVDAIVAEADAQKGEIVAAIEANTKPAGEPGPVPIE